MKKKKKTINEQIIRNIDIMIVLLFVMAGCFIIALVCTILELIIKSL